MNPMRRIVFPGRADTAPISRFSRSFTSEVETCVTVETTKDKVAIVTLNRPEKKNALGKTLLCLDSRLDSEIKGCVGCYLIAAQCHQKQTWRCSERSGIPPSSFSKTLRFGR
jgi:hypothetical protein